MLDGRQHRFVYESQLQFRKCKWLVRSVCVVTVRVVLRVKNTLRHRTTRCAAATVDQEHAALQQTTRCAAATVHRHCTHCIAHTSSHNLQLRTAEQIQATALLVLLVLGRRLKAFDSTVLHRSLLQTFHLETALVHALQTALVQPQRFKTTAPPPTHPPPLPAHCSAADPVQCLLSRWPL